MPYKNKSDQAKAAHKHYIQNKDLIKERAKAFSKIALERNKKYVADYLSIHPCIDCGNDDIRVLEFDHVKGIKKYTISDMVRNKHSLKNIKHEILKCEVRCANCHRIRTRDTSWSKDYTLEDNRKIKQLKFSFD